MTSLRSTLLALVTVLAIVCTTDLAAQDTAALDHARHILDLLTQRKFDDVSAEFNAQAAAAISTQQLEQVWTALSNQFGPFKAMSESRVQSIQGMTAIISVCQFESAALNCIVAFDAANKIGGLQFTQRPAGPPAPPAPPAPPVPPAPPQAPPARFQD